MTTKAFFRAPWRAALGVTLLFIGGLSSCSSDDAEVEPDPDKDPDTETPEATLDPLLTAKVPDGLYQLSENGHGIIFASDDAGKVLAAKEFHTGEDISLKPDQAFGGKTFTLTVVYVIKDGSNAQRYAMDAYTYTGVSRGVQWNEFEQVLPARYPTAAGTIDAVVTKSPGWDANYLYLSNDYRYEGTDFYGSNSWSQSLTLGESYSVVAWEDAADDFRFAVYENLTPGQTLEVNTDDLTQVMQKVSVPVPSNTRWLTIRLWGIPDRDKSTVNYYIGGTSLYDNHDYTLKYPDIDLFETFDGTTDLSTDDYDLHVSHHDAKYDITPIDHQFSSSASQVNPVASFSANANAMDLVKLQWSFGEHGPTPYGYGEWSVFTAPGENRTVALPLLPSMVTNLIGNTGVREQFTRNTVTFGTYDRVNGYAEWLALGTGTDGSTMNAYRGGKDWKEMVISLKK
jgi:hypothetical protein